jgi:hypothetical protein
LEEAERQAAWVPMLGALAAGLAVLCAGLAWAVLRRRADAAAKPAAAPAPTSRPQAEPAPASEAPAPDADEPPTWAERREESASEPSIEEHVDLDQQAEFLCVLGQDEAAIDLLLGHLRSTGGTSPGPYLRLMQIYRRRDDRPAYDRLRERFNQRFNAVAPEWSSDATQLRGLEGYPDVLLQLQGHWRSPLDAMAAIETLLFRRGSEDERFDLPAYEDLLFLYWLTRERQHDEAQPSKPVDVLLPIEETQAPVSVIQPIASPKPARKPAARPPVDLDLSTVPAEPDETDGERF